MSNIKNISQSTTPSVEIRDLKEVKKVSGNLYESIAITAKRANQISDQLKEELHNKLQEFASASDNLEEVFENREQIEISKHYERLPNPAILATEEFLNNRVYFRKPDEEVEQQEQQ